MQTFLQSAFLQALSHSLIASIWQMALLWFVTVLILKLFKLSPAQKFNIAFIAQLTGFVLFIYSGFNAYVNANAATSINLTSANFLFKLNTWLIVCMPYLTTIYLFVLTYKLGSLAFNYNATKGLRKYQLQKISADYRVFVQEMSELFSLNRKVNIYLSEKITCPLTIGFLKPIILIPVAAINHLTTQQMEAVILHELAHIKRADYLLFLLQNFIDKIFFFNIFSAMLSNIIELERENACDDWVLQFRYNSMHYAEALFKLGRLKTLPAFSMPFTGKKESLLLVRIKRLLHNTQNKNTYSIQSVLLGLLSIVIMLGFIISVTNKPATQNNAVDKIIVGDVAKKIEPVVFKEDATSAVISEVKKENKNSDHKKSADQTALKQKQKNLQELQQAQLNKQLNLALKQNYLVQVKQPLDSLKDLVPQYRQAINSQIEITPELERKAMSYQNFKTIENMLAASGDSINITETKSSKNSYQKEITIESFDKNGNKHTYTVIVQLYQ